VSLVAAGSLRVKPGPWSDLTIDLSNKGTLLPEILIVFE
jgi:hypothetical protein